MKTIYYHGTIETMDDDLPHATAICIEKGRISYVGNDESALRMKEAGDHIIDLRGKTMLPAFIDAHSHFSGLANSLSQCDLSKAKSFAQIVDLMKYFIEKTKPAEGEWIFGCNYDHNFLEEKAHPDKHLLNQISTTHPVVIVHASSHMGVANDAALMAQNLTKDTPDPEGGRYGRDNGELNGYMEENAFINFQNQAPMISVEKLMHLMVEAQDIYARYGITTIQEGMVAGPLFQLLQYASNQGFLKLDVVGYVDIKERDVLKKNSSYTKDYVHHLKLGGYKVFLDGSPQGRTAWMKEPYIGDDGYCGYPVHSDEDLQNYISEAMEDGMPLLAHCNGDQAAEQYIRCFEKVQEAHPSLGTHRPVMVHAQFVGKDQLKRMIPLRMMPSFFVAHTYYWGDIHIENFGYDRASRISPAKTARHLGIPFTFHQDSPVLMPDMLKTVWCATHRQTRNGVLLDQNECISTKEAIQAVTIHAAYQYHEENEKGTITTGKKADLVILDKNPLSDDLKNINILQTIKEGKTVYKMKV